MKQRGVFMSLKLTNQDRMLLNAHLTTLANNWDPESAHVVVSHLHGLKASIAPELFFGPVDRSEDDSFEGYTEAGTVSYEDRESDEKASKHPERRDQRERIGHFKVTRRCYEHLGVAEIRFGHWKPPTFKVNPQDIPPVFSLEYDTKTKKPYALTAIHWKEMRVGLSLVRLIIIFLVTIYKLVLAFQGIPILAFEQCLDHLPKAMHGKSKIYPP